MVIALGATAATLGLVGLFFVAFPLLVHGLLVFIGAQVIGERAANQALADGVDVAPDSSDVRGKPETHAV